MEVVTEKPIKNTVPEEYKQTEVGIIPEDWEVYKQKEVVEYINGRAYSKDEWESKGVPVVRLQNLTGSGDKYYYSTLNLPEKNYMYNGDLIFMWSASFGPYIWRGPKAIFHYHIWKINCDRDLVDKVFYYFKLLELTEALKQNTSGSTMLHLTKTSMEEYKIALPPTIEEQQAIAEALSDVDALIAELDALIEKKQQVKKGAMQQLLTGKKRLPGFDGQWEEKKLGEITNIVMGSSPSSNNYNKDGNGLPLIGGNADIKNRKSIKRVWTTQVPKKCNAGDVIMTVRAPVGTIAIAKDESCLGRGVCALQVNSNNKSFLFYQMIFNESEWEKLEQGSTFTSANSKQIEEFSISIPKNKEEQKAIANVLSDIDAEIQALQSKRVKYEQIKQGMMQELLTGKTRLVE